MERWDFNETEMKDDRHQVVEEVAALRVPTSAYVKRWQGGKMQTQMHCVEETSVSRCCGAPIPLRLQRMWWGRESDWAVAISTPCLELQGCYNDKADWISYTCVLKVLEMQAMPVQEFEQWCNAQMNHCHKVAKRHSEVVFEDRYGTHEEKRNKGWFELHRPDFNNDVETLMSDEDNIVDLDDIPLPPWRVQRQVTQMQATVAFVSRMVPEDRELLRQQLGYDQPMTPRPEPRQAAVAANRLWPELQVTCKNRKLICKKRKDAEHEFDAICLVHAEGVVKTDERPMEVGEEEINTGDVDGLRGRTFSFV